VTCAPETVPVSSIGKSFCIDQKLVTVALYRACAGCRGPDQSAHWPGPSATPEAVSKQTEKCAVRKPGSGATPLNCVSWEQSFQYCQKQGKRLPSAEEWQTAVRMASVPAPATIPRMGDLGSRQSDLRYEWTRDGSTGDLRVTCDNSDRTCDQKNQAENRNYDLGFRCVGNSL
jgi:formylglycine-generating enzyme required for sulfatase activity